MTITRPAEPEIGHDVWYRGWECSFYDDAEFWTGRGWQAYKGGADIDAPNVNARTFSDLLDEIDDAEEPECANSPNGRHQVDTTMESGPYNCFYCERSMR